VVCRCRGVNYGVNLLGIVVFLGEIRIWQRIANPPSSVRLRPEPLRLDPCEVPVFPGFRGVFCVSGAVCSEEPTTRNGAPGCQSEPLRADREGTSEGTSAEVDSCLPSVPVARISCGSGLLGCRVSISPTLSTAPATSSRLESRGGVTTAGEDPPPPLRAWAGLKPLDQKCQRPRGAHGAFQISGELGIAQCRRLPRFPVVLKASFEDRNNYRLFGRVYQVLHVENVEKASLDRLEVFGCYGVLNPSPYPVNSCASDFVEAMECHRDHEIALRP